MSVELIRSPLVYTDGEPVVVRVRRRWRRIDIDDDGAAVAKARSAGTTAPSREVAQRVVAEDYLNVNRQRTVIRKDDGGSSGAPMCRRRGAPNLEVMKKRLLFLLLVTGLILLALAGWTVQGLRWAAAGARLRSGVAQPA